MNTEFTALLEKWQRPSEERTAMMAADILDRADALLSSAEDASGSREFWHNFLEITGRYDFLQALGERPARYRWADLALRAIQASDYTLLDMFAHRIAADPDRVLFQDMSGSEPALWNYRLIGQRLEAIAGVFYRTESEPRVAILSNNNVESACCDLACLMYDILDTPLNVHFDVDTIVWIFDNLGINIAVADTEENVRKLQAVKRKVKSPFTLYIIGGSGREVAEGGVRLQRACLDLSPVERAEALAKRTRRPLDRVCTVMFTSGSTGKPKGVSFSMYNLVSKRFARAAALPNVGRDEVLLCYLPLFHTFGRYFEMLGTIYWGGTYVFPGNPSVETLLSLLSQVNPTGLISIPLRWIQIQDYYLDRAAQASTAAQRTAIFRDIVGTRLHWGLSAAGYLAPQVFAFFNANGVALCSGFGMTEATGGITMTPPEEYQDNSIGLALPGIEVRLSEKGELQVSGAYIGRYFDETGPGDTIPMNPDPADAYWLHTGDLFHVQTNGHYEIIDRLKDIYKNNRGQTIAPRRVEKKFDGVSGVKQTFLVGDARQYNVLLIVPDFDDPVVQGITSEDNLREYFHQIVTNANQDVAPYERVVNFAVLDRNFTIDKGELTPKGSYRRKVIEEHFKSAIDELYRSPFVELHQGELTVRIPRWFYRDLGILEDVIIVTPEGLLNQRTRRLLPLAESERDNCVRIGDLEYEMAGSVVDLGLMARQPRLWIGNGSLIRFCPCREGWDLPPAPFTNRTFLPRSIESAVVPGPVHLPMITDQTLSVVNQIAINVMSDDIETTLRSVGQLGKALKEMDERIANVVRRRLTALSEHPEFRVRAEAYRILLLDTPTGEYESMFPAFIDSGLSFLDEEAIRKIASSDLKERRLEALRQRLFQYRTQLAWPASETTRVQFVNILKLLTDFARFHPEYYDTVRSELASWILHREDPELSGTAEQLFTDLYRHYEEELSAKTPLCSAEEWAEKLIFGEELSGVEINRLSQVIIGTTFIKQSVILAFDDDEFEIDQVPRAGIWISRIISRRRYQRYRVSINTTTGKHYDLQIILDEDISQAPVLETIYWLMTLSSYPYGQRVLPRLGCARLDLGARSLVYMGDLTTWEKIREYSSKRRPQTQVATRRKNRWKKLFVKSLSAFFKGWRLSGRRIVPGALAPELVVVPPQDFREGATILSLNGWKRYENTLSLVRPMIVNFFQKTAAHYPWCHDFIDISWIFDACIEDLGIEGGHEFLLDLKKDIKNDAHLNDKGWFVKRLNAYLERLEHHYYVPIAVQSALDRYQDWAHATSDATAEARGQIVTELSRLYRLDRYPEILRYHLYRHTCFADAPEAVTTAFDTLLAKMFARPDIRAIQMIELSDLQSSLEQPEMRKLLGQLVFPQALNTDRIEISAVGEGERQYVIVRTSFTDNQGEKFTFREPLEPSEIGQLYRLFFKEGYPKTISERDKFLMVVDGQRQIIGGLCYREDGDDVVSLDGSVVAGPFMGRGIGSALLEDFCSRMANRGMRVIKTHFFLRRFYSKRGFSVDKRWGALVRFLDDGDDDE